MASATAGDLLIDDFVGRLAERFAGPDWGARRFASLRGVMGVAFHFGQNGREFETGGAFGPAAAAAHAAGRRFGVALYQAGTLQEAAVKAAEAADALPLSHPGRADVLAAAAALVRVARVSLKAANEAADASLADLRVEA